MLLVRALNDFDIIQNPENNGLASKRLIYDMTKSFYDNSGDFHYLNLDPIEKDLFIKEHISDYLVSNKNNLEKMYNKKLEYFMNCVASFVNDGSLEQYKKLKKSLSSLGEHVHQESNDYTNWISTSKDFSSVMKYYDGQDIHKMVVLATDSDKLIGDDNTIMVDLACSKKVPKSEFMYNKLYSKYVDFLSWINKFPLDIDFLNIDLIQGLKASTTDFSVNDYEVCFYQYLPKSHILSVLEALQIDLIKDNSFDLDFLFLNNCQQLDALDELKGKLYSSLKKKNDSFLMHTFDELYVKNKNMKILDDDSEKLEYNRNKILKLARNIPNPQIKK